MDVSVAAKDKADIIALNGDLDYQSYKDFEEVVENALSRKRNPIVIDISDVPHIDSVGLGTITRLWKSATQDDIALVLAGARKNVRSMIKLVNLDGRIKMFDSADQALQN